MNFRPNAHCTFYRKHGRRGGVVTAFKVQNGKRVQRRSGVPLGSDEIEVLALLEPVATGDEVGMLRFNHKIVSSQVIDLIYDATTMGNKNSGEQVYIFPVRFERENGEHIVLKLYRKGYKERAQFFLAPPSLINSERKFMLLRTRAGGPVLIMECGRFTKLRAMPKIAHLDHYSNPGKAIHVCACSVR